MAETSDTPSETLREWARDDRVTLAIVFTDIVGSTALGRALGDEQMNSVRRAHFGHSRALLAQHAGREIKTIGDSVMAVFRSIGAALDYAHAVYLDPGHTALQRRGVRAGIHIGSVDVVGEDIFGTEVDVAARVVGGIEGAEIWLSDQAKRDLERAGARRHRGLQWLSHDGVELKGIGTERLWSLVPEVSPAGAAPPVPETSASNGPAWGGGSRKRWTRDDARRDAPAPVRVRSISPVPGPMDGEVFAFGLFRLIPVQRALFEDGKPLRLGSRAFDILVALIERAGETIAKEELIARAWPDTVVEEAALRVHVAALRKALGDGAAGRRYIANHPGRGYAFIAPVTRENTPAATAAPTGTAEGGSLPTPLTRIVGRDEIVLALTTRLARRRFLTIAGPGGIGKTTVAVAVAERARASYKDGAWFVGLASLSDPDLVSSAIGAALGVPLSGGDHTRALVAWLRDRNALLVLDNCEHVIGATASLAQAILQAAPQAGILATAREPLRAEGEWLHRLAPLDLPPEAEASPTAAEALGYSAVELFNERATATTDGFVLDDANVPAVLEICRRLDGVPLALELAAARVDTFSVGELAVRLDDRFAVLTSGRRTALPRQQTLRATIDWSYGLLTEQEASLLRRLAIFPSGFTLASAAAVMDESVGALDMLNDISNLVTKSLVNLDRSEGGNRWKLLETIRAYALEKLTERGEIEDTARRSSLYLLGLCAPPPPGSKSRLSNDELMLRAREIDNVRAALDWCFSAGGDSALGVDLTAAYAPVWLHLSLMQECRERCERALRGLAPESTSHARLQMWLQIDLAVSLFVTMGSASQARDLLTRALDAAETLGDLDAQAGALASLVSNHIFQAELSKARAVAERLGQVASRIGDPAITRIADRLLGTALVMLGRPRDGQQLLERFLAAHPSTDQERPAWYPADHRAAARAFLARALWLQGLLDKAYSEAQSSLDELQSADHQLLHCRVLYFGMCRIAPSTGNFAAAEQSIARLIEAATRLNAPFWQTAGRLLAGKLMIERREFAQGVPVLREALDTCRRTGWRMSYPEFNGALATGLAGLGQSDEALDVVNEGLTAAGQGEDGHDLYLAEALRVKGEVLLRHEAAAAAEECFREALDTARDQRALLWELRVALSLAHMRVTQGRRDEARQLLAPVYDRFTEGFQAPDLRAARALLDS